MSVRLRDDADRIETEQGRRSGHRLSWLEQGLDAGDPGPIRPIGKLGQGNESCTAERPIAGSDVACR